MDNNQYQQFGKECLAQLKSKQDKIAELLLFEKVEIDNSREAILFMDGEDIFVEAEIVYLGSWGHESKSWLWAWANPSLDSSLRSRSVTLKDLSITTGREEFNSEKSIPATEHEVWNLVAIACHHLKGIGVYRAYPNNSDWFFLIRELKHFKPQEALLNKAQKAVTNALFKEGGVGLLNILRKRFPEIRVHLPGKDFRGDAEPWAHDLHAQILFDYDYMQEYNLMI